MNTARQRSEKNGRRAEILTIFLYRLMGWRLIKKRARTPFGEIDIIMRKYQRLKFIEVKYRRRKPYKEWLIGLETVLPSFSQQQRLKRAIIYFFSNYSENKGNNGNMLSIESDIVLWNGWFYFDIKKDVMESESAF